MKPARIKNIIFDLGNTLVFFDHNYFFSGVAGYEKRFGTKVFRDFIEENKLMYLLGTGRITGKKFYSVLKQEFGLTISYDMFVKKYQDIFWANNPMEKFLKQLVKEKKFNILMLSNTDHLHIPYLYSVYPHLNLIKKRVISYKVGYSKPENEIYEHIFERYQVDPAESFFIDDMPENIEKGRELGLVSHHYIHHKNLLKEFKSHSQFSL